MSISVTRVVGLVAAGSLAICPQIHASEVEAQVKIIREAFNTIEAKGDGALQKQTIKFESDEDPANGEMTRYTENGKLVKIHLSYTYGDHSGLEETYYYQKEKLVFIFASDSVWQFGGPLQPNGEPGTVDTVIEHRIYLHEGKVLRHLSKTADNKDGKDLPKAIAAAENKPSEDKERREELIKLGTRLPDAKDAAAVAKLIVHP